MEHIEGYLSRLAQDVDRTALVVKIVDGNTAERWLLRRQDMPEMGLGASFHEAKQAVHAWVKATRPKQPQPSR